MGLGDKQRAHSPHCMPQFPVGMQDQCYPSQCQGLGEGEEKGGEREGEGEIGQICQENVQPQCFDTFPNICFYYTIGL